ncbi:MAG TPA: hypothetical protein PLP33_24595 [Leptospiraceae bacterium]|nr:hypothetical protein [Leptospiraceae bacterium]
MNVNIDYSFLDKVAELLGAGWFVFEHELWNNGKPFHFSFHKLQSNPKMVRCAAALNEKNDRGWFYTETKYTGHKMPDFNFTPTKPVQQIVNSLTKVMAEAAEVAEKIKEEIEKEKAEANRLADKVANLQAKFPRLKLKEGSKDCFETRGIGGLDRLEVYEHSTLIGMGYTAISDSKAERILAILMED